MQALAGKRLVVDLGLEGLRDLPSGPEIDQDLYELGIALHDAAGSPWSGDIIRRAAPNRGFTAP